MLSAKLKSLLAVASQQSFTKAAQQLSLTQPAVSHHINQLEEEFGVSLFVRGKGGLRPTQEGEIVLKYARRIASLNEKLQLELKNNDHRIIKVNIGITHTAESNQTVEALAKCSGGDNGFSITLFTDTINNLYTMLENYEIDMAIVDGNVFEPSLNSLVLDTDFLVCVVSPYNPLSKNEMVTLNELKKQKLILRLPTSATRILFDSTLRSLNDSPDDYNIALEIDNIATIKDLVRKGVGVTVLPKSACQREIRKGKMVALPIENLSMVRETRIVYGKDFAHKELLQIITKAYRETVRELR